MKGTHLRHPGTLAALGAALLFGASTPIAKVLLDNAEPWLLSGLLYLGAGIGLLLWRRARRAPRVRLPRHDVPWLVGAIVAGGMAAPVLLLVGLTSMPATGASLLLNAEAVFTALLAWFAFRENVDARIASGMVVIVAGALVLSWPTGAADFGDPMPAVAILGACLLWALDNNLTRKVSHVDATWLAMVKGLTAGTANLVLASVVAGDKLPSIPLTSATLIVGFLAYGASLALFVVGLRLLGTGRTGAYFSVAPFIGAALAVVVLGEPVTARLAIAAALMGFGVWLHLTEVHEHWHSHGVVVHEHDYKPDDPHHVDVESLNHGTTKHRHPESAHDHRHFPDIHHRHDH